MLEIELPSAVEAPAKPEVRHSDFSFAAPPAAASENYPLCIAGLDGEGVDHDVVISFLYALLKVTECV